MRWHDRPTLHLVQFDYEQTPTTREVRLTRDTPREGDPVRVKVGGVELEARIAQIIGHVLHVDVAKAPDKLF